MGMLLKELLVLIKKKVWSYIVVLLVFLLPSIFIFPVQGAEINHTEKDVKTIFYLVKNILFPAEEDEENKNLLIGVMQGYKERNPEKILINLKAYSEGSSRKTSLFSIEEYLAITQGQKRILIVGGGLFWKKPYKLNCLLLNKEKEDIADIVMDLTEKNSVLLEPLKGLFDVVILEHLPIPTIVHEQTLTNIKTLLKTKGKLVFNPIVGLVKREGILTQLPLKTLMDGVYYADMGVGIPFMMYINETVSSLSSSRKMEIENACFTSLLKPFFERKGYCNVQIIENSGYENLSGLCEERLFQVEKP